jgi:hypothetical protein
VIICIASLIKRHILLVAPVTSNNKECFSCENVLKPSECTELQSCGPDYVS